MNIKTKQFIAPLFVAGMVIAMAISIFAPKFATAAPAPPDRNPGKLQKHCDSLKESIRDECGKAITRAINKSSASCTKSSDFNKCTSDRSLTLLKAGGNKNKEDFKQKFEAALAKVKKGDPDKFVNPAGSGSTKAAQSFFGTFKCDSDPTTPEPKCNVCGGDDNAVNTRFNFGCSGPDKLDAGVSPILDLLYSFIRFLSAGVGIIVVASIILAGIQYSASEGKPDATAAAKGRIQNALIGLIIYIFAFSLIQFLVPGGLFA